MAAQLYNFAFQGLVSCCFVLSVIINACLNPVKSWTENRRYQTFYVLSCDSLRRQNFYNPLSSRLNPDFFKVRFAKLWHALFLPRHWLITQNPIYENHAENSCTRSRNAIMAISEPVILYVSISAHCELSAYTYVRAYIFLLCIVYPVDIWCFRAYINVPPSISFEVHAPISFYEKTCGGGSNIIEPISISEIASDMCLMSSFQ